MSCPRLFFVLGLFEDERVDNDPKDNGTRNPPHTLLADELASTVYSRILRLGDIVRADRGCPDVPKGKVGVLIAILRPFVDGHTDYVYRVTFEGLLMLTSVKATHLVWEPSQRIRIGQPNWLGR